MPFPPVLEVDLPLWLFSPPRPERSHREVATRWYTWVWKCPQVIQFVASACVTSCRIKEASLVKFVWPRFKHHLKLLSCSWTMELIKPILVLSAWIAQQQT